MGRKKKEFKDLIGMKFNHLTVISLVPNKTNKHSDRYWLCECDCENKTRKDISEHHLLRGNIKSCGCLNKEIRINMNKENAFRHLYPYYKEIYGIFDGMRKRCYNEKHDNYKHYGGKGIIICYEWLNNFMNFYNWAIKSGYGEGLTIERIDYDGNYEPDNCTWATCFFNGNPWKICTLDENKLQQVKNVLEFQLGFESLNFDEKRVFKMISNIKILQQNINVMKSHNLVNILNEKFNELIEYCSKYHKNYKYILQEYDRINSYAYEAI